MESFSEVRFACNIVISSEIVFVNYDIPERNFSTFEVTIVSRSYDKRTIIV